MLSPAAAPPPIALPLRKDGTVDYQAALNDRFGKGIVPAKNANVLIWRAFGPRPEGTTMPKEYFQRLGIREPAEKGRYIIGLGTYASKHLKLNETDSQAFYEQFNEVVRRPWSAKEFPRLAALLKLNEKPLALAVAATRRPDYFNPLVSKQPDHPPGGLIGALLPSVQKMRRSPRCSTLAHASPARRQDGRGVARPARLPSAWPARRSRLHAHRGAGWHRHRRRRLAGQPRLSRTGQPDGEADATVPQGFAGAAADAGDGRQGRSR